MRAVIAFLVTFRTSGPSRHREPKGADVMTTKTKTITYWGSAAASHLARGNAAFHVIVPMALAIVALVSWATRPARRTLVANP
jgi:hypothetical protein